MRIVKDGSFKGGREKIKEKHPEIYNKIIKIINNTKPFAYGKKNNWPSKMLQESFVKESWEDEHEESFSDDKRDFVDLHKGNVFIEIETGQRIAFFRDFFRFEVLKKDKKLAAGIIITLDEMELSKILKDKYNSSRASFQKLDAILNGKTSKYKEHITVPIWYIGVI